MTIEAAIQSKLATAVASKTTRVCQGAIEQGSALPAVTWDWLPGGGSEQGMDGAPLGLAAGVVQFDAIAATAAAAAEIRELIRLAFQRHVTGLMGGASGVHVYGCLFQGSSGGYEPDTGAYVRSIDIEFQYQQAQS